jgi:hypothetical protein
LTTRTTKTQRITKTGSTDSPKPTTQTLNESAIEEKLKQEASKFKAVVKKKTPPSKIRQMSPRIYLAGQALSGLLARHQGPIRMEEVKREAFQWADFMLSDEP